LEALLLFALLVVATNDLDLISMNHGLVIKLEIDVFDNKGPDVVTEAVRVKMALW
jgi:hypothetical protein